MDAERILDVRGRLIDRGGDGARRGVRNLAGVDAQRAEARVVAESHGDLSVLCYYSRTQLHRTLFGTFAGRALLAGIALKAIALLAAALPDPIARAHDLIDTIGDIGLIGGGVVVLYRLTAAARARLLWRVRRKLILSYIFIGFVPALLIVAFFILAGLLLFFNVSAHVMETHMRAIEDEARYMARAIAIDLQSARTREDITLRLERAAAADRGRYPLVSYAAVPVSGRCTDPAGETIHLERSEVAGAWAHQPAPVTVPEWVPCAGYGGLIPYRAGDHTQVAVRGVGWPIDASGYAVIVDLPLGREVVHRFRDETGIEIRSLAMLTNTAALAEGGEGDGLNVLVPSEAIVPGVADGPNTWNLWRRQLDWVSLLNSTYWATGDAGAVMASIRMSIAELYGRMSSPATDSFGTFSFGQLLLVGVALVALSFLVIQAVAFGMGLGLARSITGSLHELFVGTERVRRGDFTQKVAIRSKDQLGELAESFNSMTGSIEDLLRQKAEKERLEEELRIARQIQMSLLPTGPLRIPGLIISAHCEPAKEVGGDYYDLLPLGDGRYALLIADVAGKGTSAALYMAELKGLILSLSLLHRSPKQLLIDANRIISQHLSERSFITMTYAVIDTTNSTFTYARAGHCPLIYRPAAPERPEQARILTPDGLVLGLRIDGGEIFERLLQEMTIPLASGDLVVLFTDGITEAMNVSDECFGEARLAAIVDEHGDAPPDVLRERILREVRAFAGPAAQHDDMTMLILKVQ